MRITNSMMISQFMQNLNRNFKRMETHSNQLETGMKFRRPSDDPIGITRSLQARTQLSKLGQYKKNVDDAQAWLTQTETALTEMNAITVRAYELAVDGANGAKTPEDRQAIAKEVEQLMGQLLEAANTDYAGRSVFGGYNTSSKPFEIRETGVFYNGENIANFADSSILPDPPIGIERIEYEIGSGARIDISMPGHEVLGEGEDNIIFVFNELFQALNDGTDGERIGKSIGKLQDKQEDILSHLAEVGGKTNRLELVKTRLEMDELNYIAIKSEIEDVDHEKAIMEFKMAEMVYRSSLAVGARIIQPTLIDFLR